jgi:ubiquinone biosynthesis protein
LGISRVTQIARVFAEEGLEYLTRQPVASGDGALEPAPAPRSDRDTAARLRRALERLGPTFVKFGQLLATRIDLFSEEFLAELGKLHSLVQPFPTSEARAVLESELGRPLEEVLEGLPETPVAAASVAQVYKARLKGTGEAVAVKIQRPGLESLLASDLDILMSVSGWIDRLVPAYRRSLMHTVAKEYAAHALQEADFLREAKAIARFEEEWGEDPAFKIPRVMGELSSRRVLVMEWLEGTKMDGIRTPDDLRAIGLEPEAFTRAMLRLQICMAYEHGFIHGDTHPGNLIILPSGRIGLIDFGLHAEISKQLRTKMLEMLYLQASNRPAEAVEVIVELTPPEDPRDLPEFKKALLDAIKLGSNASTLADARLSEQLIRGVRIGAKFRVQAQSELLLVIRNLTIVEGMILRFCPTLRPDVEVQSVLMGIFQRRMSPDVVLGELTKLGPDLLMTLARRPQLMMKLMRLERVFAESATLGEFLRKEGVVSDAGKASGGFGAWAAVAFMLCGAAVALAAVYLAK